jgi:hypothetical protein
MCNELLPKPKGLHWITYNRLTERYDMIPIAMVNGRQPAIYNTRSRYRCELKQGRHLL